MMTIISTWSLTYHSFAPETATTCLLTYDTLGTDREWGGVTYHSFAPQTAPVLEFQHTTTRLLTYDTLGTDREGGRGVGGCYLP